MKDDNSSDLKPSAQINKVLQPSGESEGYISSIGLKLETAKPYLGNYYFLFSILLETGCRISEALSIRPEHITLVGKVLLLGKKGSNDRVVSISIARLFLLKSKMHNIAPFTGMNRFTARRHLLRLGITKLKKGRINESVTHIFRDEYVKDLRSVAMKESVRSDSIGHKIVKNTGYYGKD